jgi:hypothetical protein
MKREEFEMLKSTVFSVLALIFVTSISWASSDITYYISDGTSKLLTTGTSEPILYANVSLSPVEGEPSIVFGSNTAQCALSKAVADNYGLNFTELVQMAVVDNPAVRVDLGCIKDTSPIGWKVMSLLFTKPGVPGYNSNK